MSYKKIASDACLTWVIGLPVALLAIVYGGRALVWVLTHLPR